MQRVFGGMYRFRTGVSGLGAASSDIAAYNRAVGASDPSLAAALQAGAVSGATRITYTTRSAGGATKKFEIVPAESVAPANAYVAPPPPAPVPVPIPGFFQKLGPDGRTLLTNWAKVGLVGGGAVAVVVVAVMMMKKR